MMTMTTIDEKWVKMRKMYIWEKCTFYIMGNVQSGKYIEREMYRKGNVQSEK